MTDTRIKTLLARYKEQRKLAEEAKAKSTAEAKKLRGIQFELVELMNENQLKNVKDDDGVTLYLKRHIGFSSTKENREQIRDWLLETLGDDSSMIEETVNREALGELIKHEVEQGKDETDFPDFLKVNLSPDVGVLGWKDYVRNSAPNQGVQE